MSQLLSNPMQKHVTKAEGKTESKYWALSFMTKVTKAVHLYHNRHHHNKAVRQLLPLVKWAQWLRLLERKGTEQDLWTSRRKKKKSQPCDTMNFSVRRPSSSFVATLSNVQPRCCCRDPWVCCNHACLCDNNTAAVPTTDPLSYKKWIVSQGNATSKYQPPELRVCEIT